MYGAVIWSASLAFAAVDMTASTGVRGASRTGWLATGPTTASVAAADFELTPRLTSTAVIEPAEIRVMYAPRLFYRYPGALRVRPLILHQLEGEYRQELTPRWTLSGRGAYTAGEIDYSRALLLFDAQGQPPATLAEAGILRLETVSAVLGVTREMTARDGARVSAAYGSSRPRAVGIAFRYPEQRRFDVTAEYRASLTRRDAVEAEIAAGTAWFSPGPQYRYAAPHLDWRHRLDRVSHATVRGGMLLAVGRGTTLDPQTAMPLDAVEGWRWVPVAEIGYETEGRPFAGRTMTGRLAGGITGYIDPVRATLDPRAYLTIASAVTLGRGYHARLTGAVYTPIRDRDGAPPSAPHHPSLALADVTLAGALAEHLQIEIGVHGAVHASRLGAHRFATSQREVVADVAFVADVEVFP